MFKINSKHGYVDCEVINGRLPASCAYFEFTLVDFKLTLIYHFSGGDIFGKSKVSIWLRMFSYVSSVEIIL